MCRVTKYILTVSLRGVIIRLKGDVKLPSSPAIYLLEEDNPFKSLLSSFNNMTVKKIKIFYS